MDRFDFKWCCYLIAVNGGLAVADILNNHMNWTSYTGVPWWHFLGGG